MSATKDKVTGKLKQAVGVLTNDRALEREGKLDQAVGSVKQAVESAVDTVRSAVSRVSARRKSRRSAR